MAGGAQPREPARVGEWVWIVAFVPILLAALACGGIVGYNSEETVLAPSTAIDVAPPTATERNDTVAILRDAAERQGICYGWQLQRKYGEVVSIGSNHGDGVSVSKVGCARWLRVTATVDYTSENSESEDYVDVAVEGSYEFIDDSPDLTTGLSRFGLTEAAFVEEPGWAVTRAAVSLPLLAVEIGAASPEPMVTTAPTGVPTPLPAAGSDLWRDRSGWLIGATGLLLIAVLLVVVGLVQRRRAAAAVANGRGAGATSTGRPERA